ncbi:hypothetical protein D6D25_09306 [Aureobasidium pullulans]|nr:hypothetical protein D6D25_09306 [Aureobasidium pullulans]
MDDPLKGYFNHQGIRHVGFKNHRKYRRSYHGIPQPPTPPPQCQTTQLKVCPHVSPLIDPSRQLPITAQTFFHLPLELRYQIYNQLLHSDGNKTVYMEMHPRPHQRSRSHHPSHRRVPDNYAPKSTNPLLLNPPFTSKRK